jgi:Family of unknown function (DUF6527)
MGMRASTYKILGTAGYHSEAVERLRSPGDCVIVERGGVIRQLVMKCPDGCGEVISVNLDRRSGPAWRLYMRRGNWSLFPSIDKPEGCASHFILSYGKVIWTDSDWESTDWESEKIEEVKRYLAGREMTSYVVIADELDAIPWDVLRACRTVVRQGLAVEGNKHLRGHFRLKASGTSRC